MIQGKLGKVKIILACSTRFLKFCTVFDHPRVERDLEAAYYLYEANF